MSSYSKLITVVAQSDMSRNALNHWSTLKPPLPDRGIDDLMAELALDPKEPAKEGADALRK